MIVPARDPSAMIVSLTLNPSIDVTVTTDRIVYDDHSFVLAEQEHAGGKGVNAAHVIHAYGGEVHAIATFGGDRGKRFERLLDQAGIERTLIPVAGETRRNFAINDRHGLTIKVDQVGERLQAEDVRNIEQAVIEKLPRADWLLLTGSRPPGVPADFFARMIRLASEHHVPTLLDSSGESLGLGLAAIRPWPSRTGPRPSVCSTALCSRKPKAPPRPARFVKWVRTKCFSRWQAKG